MEHEQDPESGTILVVDDEPSMRTALTEVLQRTGHPVLTSRDGQEALELLERQMIWLIVADIRMPRLGGLDLLREVKRRSLTPLMVLVTGHATLESAIAAIRLGASDYLLKPFDQEAVESLVCRLEQGHGRPNSPVQTLVNRADDAGVLTCRPVRLVAGKSELRQPSPERVGDSPPGSISEMERELILRTLERVNGNRTQAARILDISIRTLRNKLRKYRQGGNRANPTREALRPTGEVSLYGTYL